VLLPEWPACDPAHRLGHRPAPDRRPAHLRRAGPAWPL